MAAVNFSYAAAASYTLTGLSTLASAGLTTAANATAYNCTTNKPLDVEVETVITVGTVAGNKQYLVYAISSVDGTNYSDSLNVANMRLLGAVSTPTASTAYRSSAYSVAAAFGGTLPPYFKLVVQNDSGAAFTAGTVQTREVSATVV